MLFTFVSLFPNLIKGYFEDSILGRAKTDGYIKIQILNPRDFATNKHKKVDDYQSGGGAGLVMMPQPLDSTLEFIKKTKPLPHIVFLTPSGKPFRQNDAKRLAKKEHIVFVCGRYEGIDERLFEIHANEVFSIGDYILTGGELPAMVICDAISRNVERVLGNEASLSQESFEADLLEAPAFTKPNIFHGSSLPSEFLKGNHAKIAGLKKLMACAKTQFYRPDLYANQYQTCKKRNIDEK
ncbi:MAG: tRNA (guanosine(37)-N1)-methyltransferase TrmD [Campylobacteraceae bacterium]|nr:tRNA (guanosine(37)-N1)-methyltransferase TrmD [Campylobacteraceae bacterium]